MDVTIYHNPRCSKSRRTLELLRERDIEPEIVEYLENPPEARRLAEILELLGMQARDLMRKNESVYKELHLDAPDLRPDELIQAMVDNPILIERPIVVAGEAAIIGRPPENIDDLLP